MPAQLNVLIVSDYYPPYIGGGQRQTQLIAQELHKRGHKVSVVTLWRPGMPEQEYDGEVPVYRVKQLRSAIQWLKGDKKSEPHSPPFPDPVMVWELRRLISRLKPDLVHSYGWISYSCTAAMLGKNIPLMLTARDYGYGCPTRILLNKGKACEGPQLAKCLPCAAEEFGTVKGIMCTLGVLNGRGLLRRKVTGLHAISSFIDETLQRDFLGNNQHNGAGQEIPRSIIHSFRGSSADSATKASQEEIQPYLDQLPDGPFILFVGNLRLVKGITVLAKAYQRLQSPPPLVMIGTKLRDTPTSFPDGVTVLHSVPHPAVMIAFERCLFGVAPSVLPEPFGSVVHEGMSKGKAMIGTAPGGHADMIVNGETGLLVPSGDVDALASALKFLLENPDARAKMGQKALERARLFTAEVSIPRFEDFYRQLIASEEQTQK